MSLVSLHMSNMRLPRSRERDINVDSFRTKFPTDDLHYAHPFSFPDLLHSPSLESLRDDIVHL